METSPPDRVPPVSISSTSPISGQEPFVTPESEVISPKKQREVKQIFNPNERIQFISGLWAHLPISLLKSVDPKSFSAFKARVSKNATVESDYLSGKFIKDNVVSIPKRNKDLKLADAMPLRFKLADAMPLRFKKEFERIRQAREGFSQE